MMSNALFRSANTCIRIWPCNPPFAAADKDKTEQGSSEEIGQLLQQEPCGIISYATHPALFRRIYARIHSAISTGFHMAVSTGPLMHEPVDGVFFALEQLDISIACALGTDVSIEDLSELGP